MRCKYSASGLTRSTLVRKKDDIFELVSVL